MAGEECLKDAQAPGKRGVCPQLKEASLAKPWGSASAAQRSNSKGEDSSMVSGTIIPMAAQVEIVVPSLGARDCWTQVAPVA